jgi:hypothetical protein
MTRQQVYELLKRVGHSPTKAMEIAIDYERGTKLAQQWVAVMAQEEKHEATKRLCGKISRVTVP